MTLDTVTTSDTFVRGMKLTIVTGLSGSGKSVALRTLEDLGFYCVDNLPIPLLEGFAASLAAEQNSRYERTAVGIDARNDASALAHFPHVLAALREQQIECEIIFLRADHNTLLKRYSETRRKHPLSRDGRALRESISAEVGLLGAVAALADISIDTSQTNVHQLRELLGTQFGIASRQPSVLFESFGYKHGVPGDADFVFDVRCLPNPHWVPELRDLTGKDRAVAEFMQAQAATERLQTELCEFLERWIPHFEAENRSYLTVAIGCTGGQHRSVYLVECLASHFRAQRDNVQIFHRELR